MYQAGGTIRKLLDRVANQEYLLPAIQREFVWKPEQICKLFDSLLQGYPFGTFLFWKIKKENGQNYQFYNFMCNYHERDNFHCQPVKSLPDHEFVAVLDGQQRITALNIGLRGSYVYRISGKRWSNDKAFPLRHLYLNLLGEPKDETGSLYEFAFLTQEQAKTLSDSIYWFRAGRILEHNIDFLTDELDETIFDKEIRKKARITLRLFYSTIYDKDKISYYEESDQNLEKVLNIFIRMNSGGTPLSYSDLLLSIAVAQWKDIDAREEIHRLVDEMNEEGDGFNFSKDLVLKAGLMLSDIGSVGFKVENFNKSNMEILEKNWPNIRESLLLTIRLLASFGFNSQNLKADSAILPIAFYIYQRGLDEDYISKSKYTNDRNVIRSWLARSLLKASGIWGSGLDTLLTSLRSVLKQYGNEGFPLSEIEGAMLSRGKGLRFEPEEIRELSEIEYGNSSSFALLSLLFNGFNFSHHFHIDHIYPKSQFTASKLRASGIKDNDIDSLIDKNNRLPNLQLLEGSANNEKRQKMPHKWYETQFPDVKHRKHHLSIQLIDSLPETINGFASFYEQRRILLESEIKKVLST